jgi:hypothetical protein
LIDLIEFDNSDDDPMGGMLFGLIQWYLSDRRIKGLFGFGLLLFFLDRWLFHVSWGDTILYIACVAYQ